MSTRFTDAESLKLQVLEDLQSKKIKTKQASRILCLSTRQVRRLKNNFEVDGPRVVIHGLKNRISNNHINSSIKNKVIKDIKQKYSDFKPTFATEKLTENKSIVVSHETVRGWMIEAGLWKTHKQKQVKYRAWRPRKDCYGELQQFDGSYHLWFERRYRDPNNEPIEVCLLASIDDATGSITHASFEKNEGVIAVFNFWKSYVLGLNCKNIRLKILL